MDIIKLLSGGVLSTRMLEDIIYFFENVAFIFSIIIIALGIVQCFFGFKFARIFEAVGGFFLFGCIALLLLSPTDLEGATLFWAILIGIAGSFLAYKFMRAGIVFLCVVSGFPIGFMLAGWKWVSNGDFISLNIIVGILTAAVVGFLGLRYTKIFIIFNTGIVGGNLIGLGISMLGWGLGGLLVGTICVAGGCVYQYEKHRLIEMKAVDSKSHEKKSPPVPVQEVKPLPRPVPVQAAKPLSKPVIGQTVKPYVQRYSQPTLIKCDICGETSTTNFSHCRLCGSDYVSVVQQPDMVNQEAGRCPSCDTLCDEKAKFCKNCGGKMIKEKVDI